MVAGLPVRKWKVNAPLALPPGVSLILEKGCTQCDGPVESLERVTGRAGATPEVTTLFKAPGGPDRYIARSVVSTDAREFWVTVCSRGYCGGVGQVSADAQVTFHHSTDGGATWQVAGTRDGSAGIIGFTAIGPALVEESLDTATGRYTAKYSILTNGPGAPGMPIEPPAGAISAVVPQSGTTLLWRGSDNRRFLRSDGSIVFRADLPGRDPGGSGVYLLGKAAPDFSSLSVGWTERASGGSHVYQGFVHDGKLIGVTTGLALGTSPAPGAWFGPGVAYGSVALDPADLASGTVGTAQGQAIIPAVIDYYNAEITPLEVYGPIFSDHYRGRSNVVAATVAQ